MKRRRKTKMFLGKTEKSNRLVVKKYIYFVIFGILMTVSVYTITINVTSGVKLANLEGQEKELVKQNNDLSAQMFEKSSLLKTQKTAEQLGYTKPQNMLYIQNEETVAVAVP